MSERGIGGGDFWGKEGWQGFGLRWTCVVLGLVVADSTRLDVSYWLVLSFSHY